MSDNAPAATNDLNDSQKKSMDLAIKLAAAQLKAGQELVAGLSSGDGSQQLSLAVEMAKVIATNYATHRAASAIKAKPQT